MEQEGTVGPRLPSGRRGHLTEVLRRLGPAEREPLPLGNKADPFDELVYILLTVMTRSQGRIDRAFDELRGVTGGEWPQLLAVPEDVLRRILMPLGFVNRRTDQLRRLVARVIEDHDGSLDDIASLSDAEAISELVALPGVGTKTAKCVLMYSLDRDVLPVDIHVLRVAKRLGIVDPGSSWANADRELESLVPAGQKFDTHVQFVRHGRDICKSRGARCEDCVLLDICPAGPLPPDRRAAYL